MSDLLASFNLKDIDTDTHAPDYDSYSLRQAVRSIVFDNQKVALIYVSSRDFYMLPGGGIDDDDHITGLHREIKEELGVDINIISELGSIEVYLNRWQNRQVDICYIANVKKGEAMPPNLTDFELQEGNEVVWVPGLNEAIKLVEAAKPDYDDGKLIKLRDLTFLKAAQNL